ncbi:ankyrin repeat and zinc finger domain-containing protein 1-like isoform X4 [Portunus trituberculatus]|uniref:ankyrin repeat and zinc finger domain-containing protein 1-like isoform X4 n=1 Tax=Portunus trituberculatus TaxID=210409 RepID=UPI001E1D16DE|nr:ankyrin repeat and zinc finger domain-containing protein 1-like isoform X4 [Portunus trituberculatus]
MNKREQAEKQTEEVNPVPSVVPSLVRDPEEPVKKISTVLAGIHIAPGSAEYEELSNQPSSLHTTGVSGFLLRQAIVPAAPGVFKSLSACVLRWSFQIWKTLPAKNFLKNIVPSACPYSGPACLPVRWRYVAPTVKLPLLIGRSKSLTITWIGTATTYVVHWLARLRSLRTSFGMNQVIFLASHALKIQVKVKRRNMILVGIDGEQDVIQRAMSAPRKKNWAIVLLGGGHFAAAIYRGKEVIIHKTFHNYTVRAKQGGSQGTKDSQSGTVHPKSSGASLRRYNEQSQQQHVQELMESWKVHFDKCDLIFYHAKHHNRATLFGGKKPILLKNDERLRGIPFSTRRAKFSEVKRIFGLLSEVVVHGKEEEFNTMVRESNLGEKQTSPKKKKERKPNNARNTERKLKTEKNAPDLAGDDSSSESAPGSSEEMELVTQMKTFSTTDLGGCHLSMKSKLGARRGNESKSKKQAANKSKEVKKGNTHKTKVWNIIHSACKMGNMDNLSAALKIHSSGQYEDHSLAQEELESIASTDIPSDLSKICFGSKSRTMLHLAAENAQNDVIWWLLEQGCNPSVTDETKRLPFDDAADKECRNTFRRFMAQWPDRYDYKKAKIPSPLTKEQELEQAAKLALRRKVQRQAKQERQREKKQQERLKAKQEKALLAEEEDKKKFLELNDREKRALAAERRFQQQQLQQEKAPQSVLRCFMCAQDISGISPFEYNDNKFCTTKCVREHRMKNS